MLLFCPLLDVELGFEGLSDLALDYRGGRGQRQGTKPDPNDQSQGKETRQWRPELCDSTYTNTSWEMVTENTLVAAWGQAGHGWVWGTFRK